MRIFLVLTCLFSLTMESGPAIVNQTAVAEPVYWRDTERILAPGQMEKAPDLSIIDQAESNSVQRVIPAGSGSWSVEFADGVMHSLYSQSIHPLDLPEMPEIILGKDTSQIKLAFAVDPYYFSVQRWKEDYWRQSPVEDTYSEKIKIQDHAIWINQNEGGYIYEIIGYWEQGTGRYVFYVGSGLNEL